MHLIKLLLLLNYNKYWAETIEIFNDALLDAGVSHHALRAILSIGFSAALSHYNRQNMLSACIQNAKLRPDISHRCIDVGAKMVKSKSFITKFLGFALQEKVFRALGELLEADRIIALRKKSQNNSYAHLDIRVSSLMIFDEELNNYWFTKLKLFGENKSFELTRNEAIRLSSDPDYDPCPKN